jgi:hypothetical protein
MPNEKVVHTHPMPSLPISLFNFGNNMNASLTTDQIETLATAQVQSLTTAQVAAL